jgi:hypothetical protein
MPSLIRLFLLAFFDVTHCESCCPQRSPPGIDQSARAQMLSLRSVQMDETLNINEFTLKTSDEELVSRVNGLVQQFNGQQSTYLYQKNTYYNCCLLEIHLLLSCQAASRNVVG